MSQYCLKFKPHSKDWSARVLITYFKTLQYLLELKELLRAEWNSMRKKDTLHPECLLHTAIDLYLVGITLNTFDSDLFYFHHQSLARCSCRARTGQQPESVSQPTKSVATSSAKQGKVINKRTDKFMAFQLNMKGDPII